VDGLVGLLPLVGILLIFWLLVIRPASRRQKTQLQMQSGLDVGDRIVLTSGFFATVTAIHDDRLEVELAPGTTVTVARAAVGSVVPTDVEEYDEVDEVDEVERPSLEKKSDAPEPGES
jgi:preprotein translocase subunit YajC